jgi:hypothetical protein
VTADGEKILKHAVVAIWLVVVAICAVVPVLAHTLRDARRRIAVLEQRLDAQNKEAPK